MEKLIVYPENLKINYKKDLNPDQLKVVMEADGPSLVLAGAGSGKTRTLIYRLIYLLEKGIPANQILLVTFTNKASREMLGRIKKMLGYQPSGLWAGTFHHRRNDIPLRERDSAHRRGDRHQKDLSHRVDGNAPLMVYLGPL